MQYITYNLIQTEILQYELKQLEFIMTLIDINVNEFYDVTYYMVGHL